MSAKDLLDRLESLGVGLTTEVDRLRYRAPRGVLTPDLRSRIQERESDLLKLLREDGAWVHESGALGDEDHPHTELVTLYQSATAELNEARQPEIGPFMDTRYSELPQKADSASKEVDRVWRAVLHGKAELSDFQQALGCWRDLYLGQIRTFRQRTAIPGLRTLRSGTSSKPLEASEDCVLMEDARSTGQRGSHLDREARCPNPGSQPALV